MKHRFMALACLIACSSVPWAHAQSEQEQSDKQRARDRSAYLLRLSLAPMRAMCTSLDARYASRFDAASPAWLAANDQAVKRGRAETAAGLVGSGKDIEAYEASAALAFESDLASLPKARKKTRCEGALDELRASP